MATVAQVRQRALEDLGAVAIGQAADAEHDLRMTAAYNEVYEDLKILTLATWAIAGIVPNESVPHVAALMAWNAIDGFAVSPERYQRIQLKAAQAKRELRLLGRKYESLEEPTDY